MAHAHAVRIIAGLWRGRRLRVASGATTRPTPNRVRETVFNWLADKVVAARCLDLFAGTGALGFEAASRGASDVVLVEQAQPAVQAILQSITLLQADHVHCLRMDAMAYLAKASPFDLIFLDPPYQSDCLPNIVERIIDNRCLSPKGILYIESHVDTCIAQTTTKLTRLKYKQTGQVAYGLWQEPVV